MKRIAILVVLIAVLAAIGYWWYSPEQILKRRSENLLHTLTLEAGSGRSGRQLGSYALNALLAPQVDLENPSIGEANGTFSRNEIESAYAWLCDLAKQTKFELVDFESVEVDGDAAEVKLTLDGLVELPTHRMVDGRYDAVFTWLHDDDGWRLSAASWKLAK